MGVGWTRKGQSEGDRGKWRKRKKDSYIFFPKITTTFDYMQFHLKKIYGRGYMNAGDHLCPEIFCKHQELRSRNIKFCIVSQQGNTCIPKHFIQTLSQIDFPSADILLTYISQTDILNRHQTLDIKILYCVPTRQCMHTQRRETKTLHRQTIHIPRFHWQTFY